MWEGHDMTVSFKQNSIIIILGWTKEMLKLGRGRHGMGVRTMIPSLLTATTQTIL